MSKHTKGPWKYHESYPQQKGVPITITNADGRPVAGISGSSLRQPDPEANARLIVSGLGKMIETAREERERIFMDNMIWRAAHPAKKKRRRLQKKNVRYIVDTMVGLEAEKHNRNLLKIK